jgi:hypothetical protein
MEETQDSGLVVMVFGTVSMEFSWEHMSLTKKFVEFTKCIERFIVF